MSNTLLYTGFIDLDSSVLITIMTGDSTPDTCFSLGDPATDQSNHLEMHTTSLRTHY